MQEIIITIMPFAQGVIIGAIAATIVNWAIVVALMVVAARQKKAQVRIVDRSELN